VVDDFAVFERFGDRLHGRFRTTGVAARRFCAGWKATVGGNGLINVKWRFRRRGAPVPSGMNIYNAYAL
jgi:hypothetical protein